MGFHMASTKMRILRTKGLSRNGGGEGVSFRLVFYSYYHFFFLSKRLPYFFP